MKKAYVWVIAIAVIGAVTTCGALWTRSSKQGVSDYKTVPVRKGDLVETISATGTVEPEDLIDVGAQVAGRIVEFGKDRSGREIDYGSEVKQGMLLARIDDTVYQADMEQAEASLSNAQASLAHAKADLLQLTAKKEQAENDWLRAKKLGPSDALSRSSYDGYRFAAQAASANVEMGKAAIKQAEASVVQARANVNRAKQNLSYCTIPSPVDGVIIDRRVNIGQTVVASLNAPSLFLIAKDLRQVQIWVSVNEADIGSIRPGQRVTFTVDAFPDEKFIGSVAKIRLNASMTQNVVTYTVEVRTDNSNGRLLPYLTANVQFETARADNTLIVPTQALKWNPPDQADKAPAGKKPSGSGSAAAGSMRQHTQPGRDEGDRKSGKGKIWVLEDGRLRPVRITLGISTAADTAVSGPDVKEGMQVVTGVQTGTGKQQQQGSTNPFVPQIRRSSSGRGH